MLQGQTGLHHHPHYYTVGAKVVSREQHMCAWDQLGCNRQALHRVTNIVQKNVRKLCFSPSIEFLDIFSTFSGILSTLPFLGCPTICPLQQLGVGDWNGWQQDTSMCWDSMCPSWSPSSTDMIISACLIRLKLWHWDSGWWVGGLVGLRRG